MPQLVPELQDYWTENRLTHLTWKDPVVSGAGLGLDIWSKLFDFSDGSWFATLEGPYHDNLSLVSVSAKVLSSLPKLEPFVLSEEAKQEENVSTLVESFGFYKLGPAVLNALGVKKAHDIELSSSVAATLFIHDNFIFSLSTQSPGVEKESLRLVLRVHQHYLDLDLSPKQEDRLLTKVLTSLIHKETIHLSSHPSTGEISIEVQENLSGWFNRLLGRRTKRKERISLVEI